MTTHAHRRGGRGLGGLVTGGVSLISLRTAWHRTVYNSTCCGCRDDRVPGNRDEESPNCGSRRAIGESQGTVLDNVQAERSDGKCNRKIPPKPMALPWDGKGEMVR